MLIEQLYQHFLHSSGVTTDTRAIAAGNIFFALKGDKFNANTFAKEALEKGAAYVVVDEVCDENWRTEFGERLIVVDNVLATLQQLSGHHRAQWKFPVIGITGSNGKTTTKELVAAVLAKKFRTFATKGNLNNHIGVPLTLLSIPIDAEMAIVEMGANHQREIAGYCVYANPDFGLITNCGKAHLEGFGGIEGVVKGKTELYAHIAARDGKLFVRNEDNVLMQKAQEFLGEDFFYRSILFGESDACFCFGKIVSHGAMLAVECEGTNIQTQLVGAYNFTNVMSALCIGKYFGVPMEDMKSALENYTPTNNRSQQLQWKGATIILDAYNANPSSMHEALNNFTKMDAAKKAVVIGEMMELGDYAQAEHEHIAQLITGHRLPITAFVGKGFSFLKDNSEVNWFETTAECKAWFAAQDWGGFTLLIKGSRSNGLEALLKD